MKGHWRARFLAGFRALVFTGILACFHRAASLHRADVAWAGKTIPLAKVLPYFPHAAKIESMPSGQGWQSVLDAAGNTVGSVAQSAPQSDSIIGFSGSSNTLLVFDTTGKIVASEVVASGDTEDHVRRVVEDPHFLPSLRGKTWSDLKALSGIDAVSGATLTSNAIIEGLIRRTGGAVPSLRFPNEITLIEAQRIFPSATALTPDDQGLIAVEDAQGSRLGFLARSSPHSDHIIGYQGPTDTLLILDSEQRMAGIRLRETFDNTSYTDSIASDDYFLNGFNGQTISSLSKIDLVESGIEGVSGATMTSMAMAEGVGSTARYMDELSTRKPSAAWWIQVSPHQWGTVGMTLFGILMAFTSLRGKRWVRLSFQALLIAYLGWHNGHLLSQAMLSGWASNGIAWRGAPGLVFLTAAALMVPLLTGKQVYCHQLCPHGAAQQWLRGRIRRRWAVPKRIDRLLRLIPLLLIVITILATIRSWPLNLAAIEAFDAYLYPVVGLSAVTIAIVGLALSSTIPMAYCRYGCPTGAVLDYLRYRGSRDCFQRRDAVALCLLVGAYVLIP